MRRSLNIQVALLAAALGLAGGRYGPTVHTSRVLLAQTRPRSPYDDATKKRIADVTAQMDQGRKETPEEFTKARVMFTLMTEMHLGRLGFESGVLDGVQDEKLGQAVRAFEESREFTATGDATSSRVIAAVEVEGEILDHKPITLPPLYFGDRMWDRGFVHANGTWQIQGDDSGAPEQTTSIDCFRERGECVVTNAVVRDTDGTHVLTLDSNYYEIERWDLQEIVTKPLELACVRYVIRVNRVQKSVTGVRSTISKEGLCQAVSGELYIVLADGIKTTVALQQADGKRRKGLFNYPPGLSERLLAESPK